MSVNINVIASTSTARKEMADFTNQSAAGLVAMARAAEAAKKSTEAASNQIIANNRALKSAIGGLALNATMFAGPQAQSVIYPLVLMQKELKGLKSAASLAGLSLTTVGVGIAAVTAAVATGVYWWQAYQAQMNEVASSRALGMQQADMREKLFDLLQANKSRLGFGEADRMMLDLLTTLGTSEEAAAEARVRARLKEVVITKEDKKLLEEIGEIGRKSAIETLDSYDKQRAIVEEAYRRDKARIEELGKVAKSEGDRAVVKSNLAAVEAGHAKQIADINQKQDEDRLRAQRELTEEIRAREKRADEFYQREAEHAAQMAERERQKQVEAVSKDFRLSDAEKYAKLKAAGENPDGPDPTSFSQNLISQLGQLQNQFGTFSQAAAAALSSGLGTAVQGISDGIMGLIDGTKTWAQTWGSVLRSMAAQGIQFIVQQTAQFVLSKGKELLVHLTTETGKTTATISGATARTAAVAGEATMEGVGAGAKAASSVASIPYVGWALAIAAFAGVVAMITSAVSNAREMGGPVTGGVAHLVGEKGPELFVPKDSGYVFNHGDTRNIMASPRAAASAPAVNVKTVVVANLQQAVEEAMKSERGTKIIVQTIDGGRLDLGLQT